MIFRFSFGSTLYTGAVVRVLPVSSGHMPYFALSRRDHALSFTISPDADDIIFGPGCTKP